VVSLTGESGMTMIVEVEVVLALASRWGCDVKKEKKVILLQA
jgi:hypothetical protein